MLKKIKECHSSRNGLIHDDYSIEPVKIMVSRAVNSGLVESSKKKQ